MATVKKGANSFCTHSSPKLDLEGGIHSMLVSIGLLRRYQW